jgi:hypothetical protein
MRLLVLAGFVLYVLLVQQSAFASSKPWAWNARRARLDPNSKILITNLMTYAKIGAKVPGRCNPTLSHSQWAVATASSSRSDPVYTIPLLKQGGTIDARIRLGTKPDPAGDGHLTVLDKAANVEYDFWQAVYDPTTRRIKSASAAVKFPAKSVNERTTGWGGNAANTPLRRGLILPEDIKKGVIRYTMQFGMPEIGWGSPRFPALHNAPTAPVGAINHIVEGTWLRLSPSVKISKLKISKWEKVIVRALQNYGMILRDGSGCFVICGRNPINEGMKWSRIGFKSNKWGSEGFSKGFPWHKLQVLQPPRA